MVAGPFLGDCGLEGWSGMYGRTATAGGRSVRSVCGDEGDSWDVKAGPKSPDREETHSLYRLIQRFLMFRLESCFKGNYITLVT